MAMHSQATHGYVLHSRPYRETSLLVDIFSQNYGRFSLVAKGIKRKSAQSQRAILQPFTLLNIEFSGRTDLKTLCHAETIGILKRLDGRAVACGYYINELITRAIQEWQENPALFNQYHHAINSLVSDNPLSAVLRSFEVALLTELGIAPDWSLDIAGNPIKANQDYFYNLEHGFEPVVQSNTIEHTHKCFAGAAIIALGSGHFSDSQEKNCQQITQMLLRQIIGQKPLESRKLWV